MDVIDVTRQSNIRMKLRDFVEYYNSPSRTRVFNVISLEFTNTGYIIFIALPYTVLLNCFRKMYVYNLTNETIAVSRQWLKRHTSRANLTGLIRCGRAIGPRTVI